MVHKNAYNLTVSEYSTTNTTCRNAIDFKSVESGEYHRKVDESLS